MRDDFFKNNIIITGITIQKNDSNKFKKCTVDYLINNRHMKIDVHSQNIIERQDYYFIDFIDLF